MGRTVSKRRVFWVFSLTLLAAVIVFSMGACKSDETTNDEFSQQQYQARRLLEHADSLFREAVTIEDRVDEKGDPYCVGVLNSELDSILDELVETYNADPETETPLISSDVRRALTYELTASAKEYQNQDDPLVQFLTWTSEEAHVVASEKSKHFRVGDTMPSDWTYCQYAILDSDSKESYQYVWEFLALESTDQRIEILQVLALADFDYYKNIELEEQVDEQGNQYYVAVMSEELNKKKTGLAYTYYIDPSTPKDIYENSDLYPHKGIQLTNYSLTPSSYRTVERYQMLIRYLTKDISAAVANPELRSQLEDFFSWTTRSADLVYLEDIPNARPNPAIAGEPVKDPLSNYDYILEGNNYSYYQDYRYRAAFRSVDGWGIFRSVGLEEKYRQDGSSYYVGVPDEELLSVLDELITLFNDEHDWYRERGGWDPLTFEEVLYCFTEGLEEQAASDHADSLRSVPFPATQFNQFISWASSSASLVYVNDVVHDDGVTGIAGERVHSKYSPLTYDYITDKESYPDYAYYVE